MVFTHPARYEREQRKPEKQVKVGPQCPTRDRIDRVQEVVVIAPVDTNIDEAQDVTDKNRPKVEDR